MQKCIFGPLQRNVIYEMSALLTEQDFSIAVFADFPWLIFIITFQFGRHF